MLVSSLFLSLLPPASTKTSLYISSRVNLTRQLEYVCVISSVCLAQSLGALPLEGGSPDVHLIIVGSTDLGSHPRAWDLEFKYSWAEVVKIMACQHFEPLKPFLNLHDTLWLRAGSQPVHLEMLLFGKMLEMLS